MNGRETKLQVGLRKLRDYGGGAVLGGNEAVAVVAAHDRMRAALVNLRDTVDAYVCGDVGLPELSDAMDLAYGALYPAVVVDGLAVSQEGDT